MIRKMKSALTIFLIFGLVGIAVFGVFSMNHGLGHGSSGCIAAITKGIDCPKETGNSFFINFHLNAFRGFSTAVVGTTVSNALFLFAVSLLFGFGIRFSIGIVPFQSALCSRYKRSLESFVSPLQQKLIRWLALYENSPTAADLRFRPSAIG